MTILLVFLGIVIGIGIAALHMPWLAAALVGGLLGYVLARQSHLSDQLQRLRKTLTAPTPEVPSAPQAREPVREEASTYEAEPMHGVLAPEPAAPAPPMSSPPVRIALDRAVERTRAWILGGNTAVRVGAIVLFFGVAFLLKYAADHDRLPIEARLIGAALGAVVLLGIGWRLRARRRSYALAIEGCGIGILYLTVFAALRLYQLLPAPLALLLLVGIVVFSAVLAVIEDSMALAVLGTVGGFLAPILASTGAGSTVMLFTYFAILNAGVIGIAWFRAWRPLTVIGFVFTFGLGAVWGARFYRPDDFATVEPFLALFFLMYLLVPILFSTRQPPRLKGFLDGTLIFGMPLVAFALQLRLVHDFRFGLAWTAVVAGALYVSCAALLFRRAPRVLRALAEAFLAIGVVFLTLAIPMAFSGRWTSATWALEGAGILWVGVRQKRRLARAFGALLQVGAALWFSQDLGEWQRAAPFTTVAVVNADFLGQVVIALASLFSAWALYRRREELGTQWDRAGATLFLIWGGLWWYIAGGREINRYMPMRYESYGLLVFAALSSAAFYFSSRRLRWPPAVLGAVVLWPAAWLALVAALIHLAHPLMHGGVLAWPLVFVLALWILRGAERYCLARPRRMTFLGVGHALLFWLLLVLATWEISYHVNQWVSGSALWPEITGGVVPALFVLSMLTNFARSRWPARENALHYYGIAVAPVVVYLLVWVLLMNLFQSGNMRPLLYVPVLNPLDIAIALALLAGGRWYLVDGELPGHPRSRGARRWATGVFAGSIFLWFNAILIRTLHHWAHVPFNAESIFHSVLVQAALSVFWGLLALAVMWSATRRGWRAVWIVGATLLAATVVKLFLIDLSNSGSVARIVSFIAVGLLMLIVGFLSPVPPKRKKETQA